MGLKNAPKNLRAREDLGGPADKAHGPRSTTPRSLATGMDQVAEAQRRDLHLVPVGAPLEGVPPAPRGQGQGGGLEAAIEGR